MKFENTEVYGFSGALRGMRNPKESWDKGDSADCSKCTAETIDTCPHVKPYYQCFDNKNQRFVIGKNDMKLAQQLVRAGSEHRKFMRQIFVSVDITAPLYWWKEFDTYKVGTVANSCSTMHKIHAKEFTLDDFSHEHLIDNTSLPDIEGVPGSKPFCAMDGMHFIIDLLNDYRNKFLETKDKRYWWQMIQLLPSSYNQKRTVTMNYENLLAMCSKGQRRFHKLNEWSGIDNPELQNFISWARSLPYAQELIFIDELA